MALLNTADAIYLGDTPIQRVYLGDPLVWQSPLERMIALAGDKGAVWIVGVSQCWQDEDRTVPAEDGDPVRVIDDLSGNDFHWVAPNDPARPLLIYDSDYWHLLFDGVDDYMTVPSFGVPSWPHDGSGATIGMAGFFDITENQVAIISTARLSASHVGFSIGSANVSGNSWGFRVTNADSPTPIDLRPFNSRDLAIYRGEHALEDSPQATMRRYGEDRDDIRTGDYQSAPSSAPAEEVPHLMKIATLGRYVPGRWHGACLLPVTGHGVLVDQVLQAYMPPIQEPSP